MPVNVYEFYNYFTVISLLMCARLVICSYTYMYCMSTYCNALVKRMRLSFVK